MAKDFEMGYLLDFYGEVLTPKQREMLRQYYNDDLSLSEIGENFGITRQGARDAIKHGETDPQGAGSTRSALRPGTAGCRRRWKSWNSWSLTHGSSAPAPMPSSPPREYAATLNKMLRLIRSIDEVNES